MSSLAKTYLKGVIGLLERIIEEEMPAIDAAELMTRASTATTTSDCNS